VRDRENRQVRERELRSEPEAEAPRSEPAPDPRTLAALARRIQQSAGNVALQRVIARQPTRTALHEIDPHEGGDDALGLSLLAEGAERDDGGGAALPPGTMADAAPAPPGPTQAPAPPPVPAEIATWQARKPATNLEYAQWILDAEAHGFVKFLNVKRSKEQLESLRDGKPVVGADPADQEILGGLVISHALITERATRWASDTNKPKDPFQMGDYIRNEHKGHSTGERVDIGGFDWSGAKGPGQIITALKALPPDKYGIGLPFQGEFFPRDQWFNPQATQAVADAEAAGKTTAEITTPLLAKGSTQKATGTWSKDDVEKIKRNWDIPPGWKLKSGGGSAFPTLKSAELKKAIKDLNANGYDIYVFPDNENHLHVQQGNG
jgi:hypothetical protein